MYEVTGIELTDIEDEKHVPPDDKREKEEDDLKKKKTVSFCYTQHTAIKRKIFLQLLCGFSYIQLNHFERNTRPIYLRAL